jgi:apolipoprotein N-acyltransferase
MSSTVGISAFVSADGRAHAATGFNTPAVEVRELHLSATRTLATDLGAGPEYGLLTVAVVILAGAAYRRSNPRPVTTGDRRDSEGEV